MNNSDFQMTIMDIKSFFDHSDPHHIEDQKKLEDYVFMIYSIGR